MRLIPGLRGKWFFNLCSIIALGFIFFTYFGVNFYLAGLHAYQSGGEIQARGIVIAVGTLALLGTVSFMQYQKHYKK